MSLKQKLIALLTIIHKEKSRLHRIWIMAFLGPMISMFLYFLIFGNIIGSKIDPIDNITYIQFITPGLILSSIIFGSYGQVSASFFLMRFQKNIEEMLVTPMSHMMILTGFIIAGIIRAFLIAIIMVIFITFIFHVEIFINADLILDVFMCAYLFSLMGFTNAILAKDFNEITLIPSFVLVPLCYLGGVFYNINMLSPTWKKISLYNPIAYMIKNFREHLLNLGSTNALQTNLIVLGLIILFIIINLRLMKKGMELRK